MVPVETRNLLTKVNGRVQSAQEIVDAFDKVFAQAAENNAESGAEKQKATSDNTQLSIRDTKNRSWADQLKNRKRSDTLVALTKPDSFIDGIENLPMAVPISVITKAQSGKDNSHSVSDTSIEMIPDGIKKAPIVVDNPARNSIIYITDIEDGDGLVIVSFLKDQTFDGDRVHKATSIHTRTNPIGMLKNLEAGSTVYVRKNKLDAVPGSSLLNAGTLNANIKFINNIIQQSDAESQEKISPTGGQ